MAYQLRKLCKKDSSFIQGLFQSPHIMKFIAPVWSDEQAKKKITTMFKEMGRDSAVYWVIVRSSDKMDVGLTSVHWYPKKQTIKLGIMIAQAFQNKGVFKLAQANAIELAKSMFPVECFVAVTHKNNSAAKYCYQRIGFKLVPNEVGTKNSANFDTWQLKNTFKSS